MIPKNFIANFLAKSVCIFLLTLAALNAQAQSREYQIKAVFLLNFAQFAEWPSGAFAETNSPLVIGVMGDDPFDGSLQIAVRNETVDGRKFVVEKYRSVQEIKNCQILFICRSETRHLEKIVADLKRKPILTVSDIESAATRGACVEFVTANNKIRLMINTNSVKDANLTLSSKLLGVAQLVPAK